VLTIHKVLQFISHDPGVGLSVTIVAIHCLRTSTCTFLASELVALCYPRSLLFSQQVVVVELISFLGPVLHSFE
jgi:hypothetical protein